MKIAFTTKGTTWESLIDPRFGRTAYIVVYQEEADTLEFIDNQTNLNDDHGAGTKTAKILFDIQPDILITGNGPGSNAAEILNRLNLKIYTGAAEMTVRQAYEAYLSENLNPFN